MVSEAIDAAPVGTASTVVALDQFGVAGRGGGAT